MDKKTRNKVIIISAVVLILVLTINPKARAALLGGQRASLFAKRWVGIEEKGVNKAFGDKVFQAMMSKVGWNSGDQWCMYFAKAVHYDTFPEDRDIINRLLNGSTQLSWKNVGNDKSGTYQQIKSGLPQIGDIAIWQLQTNTAKGHAGVVTNVYKDYMETTEGNTNQAGAREGDSVLIKKRPFTIGKNIPNSNLRLLGFIRHKSA